MNWLKNEREAVSTTRVSGWLKRIVGSSYSLNPPADAGGTDSMRTQKFSFNPNWIIRGFTAVDVIVPNAADETFVLGLLNCVWLNALKNSARNSTLPLSPSRCNGVRLIIATSVLFCPGPSTIPTPLLPKPVARASSPTTVQIAVPAAFRRMQALLK